MKRSLCVLLVCERITGGPGEVELVSGRHRLGSEEQPIEAPGSVQHPGTVEGG